MGYRMPSIKNMKDCTSIKNLRKGKDKGCGLCILTCPDQAIEISLDDKSSGGDLDG